MTEFNRQNPLFERARIPFEVLHIGNLTTSNANGISLHTEKKVQHFTLRILEGRRPIPNQQHVGTERAIRLEISDECSHFHRKSKLFPTANNFTQNLKLPATPYHGNRSFSDVNQSLGNNNPPIMMQKQPMFSAQDEKRPASGAYSGPVHLYELEVGETDFCELRRDLALLVDFQDFASSFITLLQFCDLGDVLESEGNEEDDMTCQTGYYNQNYHANHKEDSTPNQNTPFSPFIQKEKNYQKSYYSCRLEITPAHQNKTSYPQKTTQNFKSNTSKFSIVESNQFRELAHLSLNLNHGTDSSIRSYLSARLAQAMSQNGNLKERLQNITHQANAAEISSKEVNKKLNDMMLSSETEKRELKLEWGERTQKDLRAWEEKYKKLEFEKEEEKTKLAQGHDKLIELLRNKLLRTEKERDDLNHQRIGLESQVEKLQNTVQLRDDTVGTLKDSLGSLRSQFSVLEEDSKLIGKKLHQKELQVAALEQSNESQEKVINQLEALRNAAQDSTSQARLSVDKQTVQITELKSRLSECELREKKTEEILCKFQQDRTEMKAKLNRFIQILKKQEEAVVEKEKEISSLEENIAIATRNEKTTREEKESKEREVNELHDKIGDLNKSLESNQQVISWLNKEVNEAQLGRNTRPHPYKANSNTLNKSNIVHFSSNKENHYPLSSSKTPYPSTYITQKVKDSPHFKSASKENYSFPRTTCPIPSRFSGSLNNKNERN